VATKTTLAGHCSLCGQSVRQRDSDGAEMVRHARKLVPHRHRRDYRVRPVEPDQDGVRGWEDYAHRMGAG
jgi:hypothetical protein